MKHCKVIYLKTHDIEILNNFDFDDKIVISDSIFLYEYFYIKGIIFVLNLNSQKIPEGIDCIISTSRDSTTESRILQNKLSVPIIYYHTNQLWCGSCGKLSTLNINNVGKYCSESCMSKIFNFKISPSNDVSSNTTKKVFIAFSNVSNNSQNNNEKFQQSMIKEAQRIEFAYRKESYKNEMRQPSHRKTKIITSNTATKVSSMSAPVDEIKYCQSKIKNGTENCKNRALKGSNYCGISSHKSKNEDIEL